NRLLDEAHQRSDRLLVVRFSQDSGHQRVIPVDLVEGLPMLGQVLPQKGTSIPEGALDQLSAMSIDAGCAAPRRARDSLEVLSQSGGGMSERLFHVDLPAQVC